MAFIQVFDTTSTEKKAFKQLSNTHKVVYVDEPISLDVCDSNAEIITVFVSSTVSAEIIDALPKLKLIACRSTGFNNIDLVAARKRGIHIVNVPTYGEYTVAEFAIGLMIALLRNIITDAEQLLTGDDDSKQVHGTDLRGKTLGVIGLGRIGIHVAQLAEAFGMTVLGYDPFVKDPPGGVTMLSLEELASKAEVISLHAPLTKDTTHIVSESLLAHMRDGVYIINTARGELIDTAALLSALKSGKVAGAALDVLEDEKLVEFHEEQLLLKHGHRTREVLEHVIANSILMRMPNVILTNHNAYNTVEAIGRINQTTIDNITHYLAGDITNEIVS